MNRTVVGVIFLALHLLSALAGIGPAAATGTVPLAQEERQWLAQHEGTIRVGITVIPPQILRNNGEFSGLAIDYIHLMERKLGCRFTLVPYATWNEVIQAAKDRRIDMIFAAQSTPERLAYLRFTEPYIELPNMIVVRKGRDGGRDLKEMKGWSVAASGGSAVHEYLKTQHPQLDLRPVGDELSGLMKLSLGEVDAMVVEISRASYYIEKAGIMNLRVSGDAGLTYRLRFAVRSDWPILCGILDKGLLAFTPDEKHDINRRWVDVGEKSVFASLGFRISLAVAVVGIALAITGVSVWNRALRRIVRERTAELEISNKTLEGEIEERKRAEENLRQMNEHFRSVLRAAKAYSIIGTTPEGIITVFNEGAELMLGYGADEVIGKVTPTIMHHPDELAARAAEIGIAPGFEVFVASARKGEMETREWTYIRKDGSRITVTLTVTAMRNETGELTGFIGVAQDITDRKRNEEMLHLQAAELEQEVAERQRAQEELEVLNEELEARVRQRTAELSDKNGELQKAYDELKIAQARLLQQDKMASIGQLAAGVAHEINNPMGFIGSNLTSLGRYIDKLTEYMAAAERLAANVPELTERRKVLKIDRILQDLPELLSESHDGAERVRRIVQELKAFSHVDRAEQGTADLNEGLESTLAIVWNELKYKATVIKDYGRIPPVSCCPGQLNQVFMNLLVNAAQAIEKQGEIRILTRLEGENVRIVIADNGQGIPPEALDRIFEPFFTTKEVGKGTGLGLSIAYDIVVNKHHGNIEVQSEAGKGTTFTISLPIAGCPVKDQSDPAIPPCPAK